MVRQTTTTNFIVFWFLFWGLFLCSYLKWQQPDGAIVSRGSFYFYTTKFCFVRDCALNSVDSTYGVITFPSRLHSNEFDRVSFDLRDDEYLDINMITPHECFYFGWGIYLMDRWFDYKYQQYGASLNDTLNSFQIAQALQQGKNAPLPDPFRKEVRLFVSYNPFILDELHRLYGPQNNIFYMTWNSFTDDMIPFNSTGDRLSIYFRIMMPANQSLLADYIKDAPVTVYRYQMNVEQDVRSKPLGLWRARSLDGLDEPRLIGTELTTISSDLSLAIKRISGLSKQVTLTSLVTRNSINYDSGWDCIRFRKVCYIDNRDTVYIGTGLVKDKDIVGYNLQLNSLVLLVGVNHTFYNNSLYNSLQLYDYTSEQGFYSFHGFENVYEKSRSYKNSCKITHEKLGISFRFHPEQFYCILVSRNNFTDWGLPRELSDFYKVVSEQELPYTHLFNTVERSYLQGALSISAAYSKLLFPIGKMIF